jgi:hypothetical protein
MDKIQAAKICNRVFKKLKLDIDDWNLMEKIYQELWDDRNEDRKSEYIKTEVCGHFGLKNIEFKALRMHFWGQL